MARLIPVYERDDAQVRQFLAANREGSWSGLQRYAEVPPGTRDSGLRGLGGKPKVVHEGWQLSHCPRIRGAAGPGALLQRGAERVGGRPARPGGYQTNPIRGCGAPDEAGRRLQGHGGGGESGTRPGEGETAHSTGPRRLLAAWPGSAGDEAGGVLREYQEGAGDFEEAGPDPGDHGEGDARDSGDAFAERVRGSRNRSSTCNSPKRSGLGLPS